MKNELIIIVAGEPKTGKTTLIQWLQNALQAGGFEVSYQGEATPRPIAERMLERSIALQQEVKITIQEKNFRPVRKITELERSKGRSENFYSLSNEDQWAQDKRLGLLDWDGKE